MTIYRTWGIDKRMIRMDLMNTGPYIGWSWLLGSLIEMCTTMYLEIWLNNEKRTKARQFFRPNSRRGAFTMFDDRSF